MSKETFGILLGVGSFIVFLALYLVDRSGKSLPIPVWWSLMLLLAALSLTALLLIPWFWPPGLAERIWRVSLASASILLLVSKFGIWLDIPPSEPAPSHSASPSPSQPVTPAQPPPEKLLPQKSESPEALTVVIDSEIVSRVYARGPQPPPGVSTATYNPYLQEFFYDWIVRLTPEQDTGKIIVTVKDPVTRNDRIRVEPDIASISNIKPGWLSGFEEPSRKPDYFVRTVRIPSLEKGRNARLIFRRSIQVRDRENEFTAADFTRSVEISAEKCQVKVVAYDQAKQFMVLMQEMLALGQWRYSGKDSPPLPVRLNPDEPLPILYANEIEVTLEVRCADSSCQKITMSQMEARKGSL